MQRERGKPALPADTCGRSKALQGKFRDVPSSVRLSRFGRLTELSTSDRSGRAAIRCTALELTESGLLRHSSFWPQRLVLELKQYSAKNKLRPGARVWGSLASMRYFRSLLTAEAYFDPSPRPIGKISNRWNCYAPITSYQLTRRQWSDGYLRVSLTDCIFD